MIAPLYLFVFLGLFSPGPNVILLTTSGARFGFRATLPHVAGVVIGVGIVAGLTGLGIGTVLKALPALEIALKIIAGLWILWMAVKLWQSTSAAKSPGRERPFTFFEAVLFQWVNPKLWAVALAATGFVTDLAPSEQMLRLAVAFSGLNLFVCLFWSFAGELLRYLLTNPHAWVIFMRGMAVALAASALMLAI